MAAQKILLPYNFTEMDRKALAFVVRTFNHLSETEIILFHLYTPLPAIDVDSSTITGRLSSGMQYLSKQLREKEAALTEAKTALAQSGFDARRIDCIFRARVRPVADEIIETHRSTPCDLIVLSCRPYRITRRFIQSVHSKVVSSVSGVTVCIVT